MNDKVISDDRRRQVETTRKRHGKDFYQGIGAMPHPRGFSNPDTARKAALKMHENRRKKRLEADNG